MAIKYDIYEIPSVSGNGEKILHARVLNSGLVTTSDLAKEIEHSTSLTKGDVIAVLSSLSYLMIDNLLQGKRIHLDGVGYFQLSVKAPSVNQQNEMRARHIKANTIKFIPEKKVKKMLSDAEFKRTKHGNHSSQHSKESIYKTLSEYFTEHAYITRAQFQELFGFARTTAISRINELLQEGVLAKNGPSNFPIYERKNNL